MADANFTLLSKKYIVKDSQKRKPTTNADESQLDHNWKRKQKLSYTKIPGPNKVQHDINSNSSNENSSTKNSNEAGATAIQECCAKPTKVTEGKQVDVKSNHVEEMKAFASSSNYDLIGIHQR